MVPVGFLLATRLQQACISWVPSHARQRLAFHPVVLMVSCRQKPGPIPQVWQRELGCSRQRVEGEGGGTCLTQGTGRCASTLLSPTSHACPFRATGNRRLSGSTPHKLAARLRGTLVAPHLTDLTSDAPEHLSYQEECMQCPRSCLARDLLLGPGYQSRVAGNCPSGRGFSGPPSASCRHQ